MDNMGGADVESIRKTIRSCLIQLGLSVDDPSINHTASMFMELGEDDDTIADAVIREHALPLFEKGSLDIFSDAIKNRYRWLEQNIEMFDTQSTEYWIGFVCHQVLVPEVKPDWLVDCPIGEMHQLHLNSRNGLSKNQRKNRKRRQRDKEKKANRH